MRKRKNIFASLDLGPEELRLTIIQKRFYKLNILVNERFCHDDLSSLSQRIQEYRPKEIIMLLPTERVLVRDITLPPADKSMIRSMLYFELSGRIPYSMEQIHLDYILLKRTKKEIKVKAFIIPELLHREVEALRNVGIEVNRLLPRGLALVGYLANQDLGKRLVKFATPQGELVLYPHVSEYFSRVYYPGQTIDEDELQKLLSQEGAEPDRWDFLDIHQPEADLIGAVHFHLKYSAFNLLTERETKRSYNLTLVGIISLIVLILLVNSGTFYLNYLMKKNELVNYQERLDTLIPRQEKIKDVTAKTHQIVVKFEDLQNVYLETTDYLIWLRQLHFLLQEDTEVNILVLEDNILRELHGISSSATDVSDRLQKSLYFTKAEFTSPITSKEVDGKEVEEFNITAVLLNPQRKGAGVDE